MAPKNKDVGRYNLKIKAIDSTGLFEKTSIPFEILNINDKPFINKNVEKELSDLLNIDYLEDYKFNTGPLSLFNDDDLIHNTENLSFEIIQGDINDGLESNLYAKNILNIENIESKNLNLSFDVPLGLTEDVKQTFKLEASDYGENTNRLVKFVFQIKADLTPITKKDDENPLGPLHLVILMIKILLLS